MHRARDEVKVGRVIRSCKTLEQVEVAHALMYRFMDFYKTNIHDLRRMYFEKLKELGDEAPHA